MTNFTAPPPKPKPPAASIPWRYLTPETWALVRALPDKMPRRTPEGALVDYVPESEFVRRFAMAFDARVAE